MKQALAKLATGSTYWLLMLILGIAMEVVALYYQYGLDYGPCVLCIHVRIYVMGFILVALFGLFSHKHKGLRLSAHIITLLLSLGLTERSWMTLGVERGFIEGACDMNSGLPAWFALDKWFPAVFEPWEPCGYTPELLMGITMAEGLMIICPVTIIVSILMIFSSGSRNQSDLMFK
ncbi:MAG: disulfide bond formation protein B [Pontibacterium sp.]